MAPFLSLFMHFNALTLEKMATMRGQNHPVLVLSDDFSGSQSPDLDLGRDGLVRLAPADDVISAIVERRLVHV